MVGHPGPDEHIDPDKIGAGGVGNGQGPNSIIPENVDAQGTGKNPPCLDGQGGHGGKGAGRNGSGMKRGIAEIFKNDAVGTAFFQ